MSSVLDAKLFIKVDFDFNPGTTLKFTHSSERCAHFVNQLMVFDTVVIPTYDMAIIACLANWLGPSVLLELLSEGVVKFTRLIDLVGYVGQGIGLCAFKIGPQAEGVAWPNWWGEAMFGADIPKAADLQLRNLCPTVSSADREKLVAQATSTAQEISTGPLNLAKETFSDIYNSEELRHYAIALDGYPVGGIDLVSLPRFEGKSLKCLHDGPIVEAADLVLKAAELNLQLGLAHATSCTDVVVDSAAPSLLLQKLKHNPIASARSEGFGRLLEINNVADLGIAFKRDGGITARKLLELRRSREARKFRSWLSQASPHDAEDLSRLFLSAISSGGLVSSLPAKILRFVFTTAWGIAEPVSGLAASAVDSFFVDKWLRGFTPKLYLDRLAMLAVPQAVAS